MANHCRLSQATAKAIVDAVAGLVDGGASDPGKFIIYTGAEPSLANDAAGTEVATCECATSPAFGTATYDAANTRAKAALAGAAEDESATGNASAVTYFRLADGDDAVVLQGTAGTSGTDLIMNSATVGAGASVLITQFEIRISLNQA